MENKIKSNDFSSIKIGLASPETIHSWSHGEVTKAETINYRTLKPEADGLFCEKIFGPVDDYECHCKKYKKTRFKGKVCENCGVEITSSKVRRDRMGHIDLAAPVAHIWYYKGTTSRIGQVLGVNAKELESVISYNSYIVIDPGDTTLEPRQILSQKDHEDAYEKFENDFRDGMGAEAIKEILENLDPVQLRDELVAELETANLGARPKILKRLKIVDAFAKSDNKFEWMVLDVLPVIPPDLRPMVPLDGGRFAASDLNDLYRRVINRNNRLKSMIESNAPEIIVKGEKRLLQSAVDELLDNGRTRRPASGGSSNRPFKSLTDMLKGKQGRFRQNLLGKRVDYSGRSVIVIGPELKMYQCGLPKEMAVELFKPYVVNRLVKTGFAPNVNTAKKVVEKAQAPEVWDALDVVIKDHPVLLNRAPTLHRLSIQAFQPVLVEGKAIKLHPLACTGFNADFDGDQMAVHVPLSAEAQAEARMLMLASNNLLKPADGKPVTVPSQDMIIGSYYLTMLKAKEPGAPTYYADANFKKEIPYEDANRMAMTLNPTATEPLHIDETSKIGSQSKKIYNTILDVDDDTLIEKLSIYPRYNAFRDADEAMMAYQAGCLGLHSLVLIRFEKETENGKVSKFVKTTMGRVIFNKPIPQDLGFIDRSNGQNEFELEISTVVDKKVLGKIVEKCIKAHGIAVSSRVLDDIKSQGYKYSTISGTTFSVNDVIVPARKKELVQEVEDRISYVSDQYRFGFITEEERFKEVTAAWEHCTELVKNELEQNYDVMNNPLDMILDSGARGNLSQLNQLAGMKGLVSNTKGETIEVPIRSNYSDGLNILEYFISSRGSRKGLTDTALRTADSGYLTRRLVDVSHDVIIREHDCGCHDGIMVSAIADEDGGKALESFEERLIGRYLAEPVVDPNTGEVIVDTETLIREPEAKMIVATGITETKIRSLITCTAQSGVCAKCYGSNLAFDEPMQIGESVGTIAAQSIGEPGTQLTMRNFHNGGVTGGADVTQGLPRVEELFEARKPKTIALLAEFDGEVRIEEIKKAKNVYIYNNETGDTKKYLISYGLMLQPYITDGYKISKGEEITVGSKDPHDILRILGEQAVEDYLIQEVQRAYRTQSVDINDKHIEIIIRQMLKKCIVTDSGDTNLIEASQVDVVKVLAANEAIEKRIKKGETSLKKAKFDRLILGISKAALATDSFLSAASFQETPKVLTEAAIEGKVDHLVGLKENAIIGKLIPAGTGMTVFKNVEPVPDFFNGEGTSEVLNLEQLQQLLDKSKHE